MLAGLAPTSQTAGSNIRVIHELQASLSYGLVLNRAELTLVRLAMMFLMFVGLTTEPEALSGDDEGQGGDDEALQRDVLADSPQPQGSGPGHGQRQVSPDQSDRAAYI